MATVRSADVVIPAGNTAHLCYAYGPTAMYSDAAATTPFTHVTATGTVTIYFDDTVAEGAVIRIYGREAATEHWDKGHNRCHCITYKDYFVTVVYTTV